METHNMEKGNKHEKYRICIRQQGSGCRGNFVLLFVAVNRKEKQAMKEKGIKVKVVFTEGYQKRFTEALCRVLEERERGQELARMVQDLKDNGKGEVG